MHFLFMLACKYLCSCYYVLDMSILKEGPIRKAVSQRLSDDKR